MLVLCFNFVLVGSVAGNQVGCAAGMQFEGKISISLSLK